MEPHTGHTLHECLTAAAEQERNRKEMQFKTISTAALTTLNTTAAKHKFNRQLHPDFISKLDPDGYHVATLILFDHTRHHFDGDSPDPMHHRVMLYTKVAGNDSPVAVFLDVTHDDWQNLEAVSPQDDDWEDTEL